MDIRRRAGVLIGVVVAAAVVIAVVVRDSGSGSGPRSTAPVVAVAARDRAYAPPELDVPAGGVVAFTNDDGVEHTFTADGGLFDSGRVPPGGSFRFPLPARGVVTYHCEIHPSMTGRITVGAADGGS